MNLRVKKLETILSPKLIKILKEMNHEIADDLLNVYINDEYNKISFIDVCTDSDKVSFIQCNKIPELIENDIVHGKYTKNINSSGKWGVDNDDDLAGYFDYIPMYKNDWISDENHVINLHEEQFSLNEHNVWVKNRSEMKIGRLIKTLLNKDYPANVPRNKNTQNKKPNDVESFVNQYIAVLDANSKKIDIVKGDDIIYWYNKDNYLKTIGTLGGSCMNLGSKKKYMELYSLNPEKVEMIILYPETTRDKIIGRALLWTVETPDGERQYMDRIYTTHDSDEYLFINYAKQHNFLYKSTQQYGWEYDIIDPKDNSSSLIKMSIDLNEFKLEKYPYSDTLQYINIETGQITNDYNRIKNIERVNGVHPFKLLTSDGGIFCEW